MKLDPHRPVSIAKEQIPRAGQRKSNLMPSVLALIPGGVFKLQNFFATQSFSSDSFSIPALLALSRKYPVLALSQPQSPKVQKSPCSVLA
jgi:hypothetical protein